MEPSGPTSGIPQTLLNRLQPVSPHWQLGQRLQATVLENSAGKILLTTGNRQLSAASSLPFEPGQVLTLQVDSLGEQPVLRVVAALQESASALAVRTLLPRYGLTTPLLANLSQLATATGSAPLPPVIGEIARSLVRQLPDIAAMSTPQGVRAAIRNSGSFLEHHLALAAAPKAPVPVSFDSDFKANLLRLLQLVRNWPGGDPTSSTPATARPGRGPAAPGAGVGATTLPPPTVTGNRPATPGAATDGTPATPPPAAPPSTVQRALDSAGLALPPRAAATLSTAAATAAGATTPASGPANATGNAPPPFAGVVPTPQAPVQATIELLNRLGHLRLDLLQQTEAAVARIHLNQLASLPREAEHRLVEWLFDIPVRRGDAIDLWSARIYRDADDKTQGAAQTTAQWRIQLAFDLPGLGPMQAQVSLRGERVSTHFWATEAATLPLLRQHLHELRRGMLAVGLEVGEIDCQQGTIPESASGPPDPLINEKA
jgi:hypothetical protein